MMRRFTTPIAGALLSAGLLCMLHASFAQFDDSSTCVQYQRGMPAPAGYAPAWDVFDTYAPFQVLASCPNAAGKTTLSVGSGAANRVVYANTYAYEGSQWKLYRLTGNSYQGNADWLSGKGTVAITPPSGVSRSAPLYFVGYVCTATGVGWKCGCTNTACAQGYWQLQGYIGSGRTPTTPPAQSCSEWVDFKGAAFSLSSDLSLGSDLGISVADLAAVIQARSDMSPSQARLEATQILSANWSIGDLGFDQPITVRETNGLSVSYRQKLIQTVTRESTSGSAYVWGPVSFQDIAAAERPDGSGAAYVLEAALRHNFELSGATARARASLVGCPNSGGGGVVGGSVVRTFPARTIMHPANVLGENGGGGLIENIQLPPADQYYLDYTLKFGPFDWDTRKQSGKIPGLAGGTGTGGCAAEVPNGWSARQTFAEGGKMTSYLYYQNRPTNCGYKIEWKNPDGTQFRFQKDRVYRVTQRVKVNTPGVANGENEIWVDGTRVFFKNDFMWRGNVDPSVARVSMLKYHSYFGGKSPEDSPSYDSYIEYGPLYVMSCTPDFAKTPGTCRIQQ